MALYRYFVCDWKSGATLAELPLVDVSYTDALTGIGTATASIAIDHPKATHGNLGGRHYGRELIIVRQLDTGAWKCVWNGPIVKRKASLKDQKVTLEAVDPFWYLTKRTLEVNKRYVRRAPQIALDLYNHAVGKVGGGLYRFSIDNVAGTGDPLDVRYDGADHQNIGKAIMDLSALSGDGFDFRMKYDWNDPIRQVTRRLEIGAPYLGNTVTGRGLEIGTGLTDLIYEDDFDRSANRTHIHGGGTGDQKYGKTVGNAQSLTTHVMLENVHELNDLTSQAMVDAAGEFLRGTDTPPVITFAASYRPTAALPFDWCLPGDTIKLKSPYGFFDETGIRRVTSITTSVDDAGLEEEIAITFFAPGEETL